VDQYFSGSNNSIQHASVTNLLTAVMAALKRVPERKFVYVEQAFFQRWWRQQNDEMQAMVRSFLANGQLEFINGGWCMHDEADTHYIDMIDQTTLGHQYIVKEFGAEYNPTIGWQIGQHSGWQSTTCSRRPGTVADCCPPLLLSRSLRSLGHAGLSAVSRGWLRRSVLRAHRLPGSQAASGEQGDAVHLGSVTLARTAGAGLD
jgi:hypothetical protein